MQAIFFRKEKAMTKKELNNKLQKIVSNNQKLNLPHIFIGILGNRVIQIVQQKDKNGIYELNIADEICSLIRVKEVQNNISDGVKTCTIEFINDAGKLETLESFPRIKLCDAQKCIELAKYGVDVSSLNAKIVVAHLQNELKRAQYQECTKQAGIVKMDGKYLFTGNSSFYYENSEFQKSDIRYIGNYNLEPSGKLKSYKQFLNSEIAPSEPLSVALAIGGSALFVGYLHDEIDLPNIVVHLSGDSSIGKSTAMMLAISIFGGFKIGKKTSLFGSWNATDNAILEMLNDNYGVAVGLDEAGMSKDKQFAPYIYRIAHGADKQRLDYEKGNKPIRGWHTTILSTGEIPLADVTDKASGQKVRLISLDSIQWTNSAEQSEKIKAFISKNHGTFAPALAKYILRQGTGKWKRLYEQEREKILQALNCDCFKERLSKRLAIIMLSATAMKHMHIDLDLDKIRDFLCQELNKATSYETSISEAAYSHLQTEIVNHTNNIEIRCHNGSLIRGVPAGTIWGVAYTHISSNPDKCIQTNSLEDLEVDSVNIPLSTVETFLINKGYHNCKAIYQSWMQQGHIEFKQDAKGISNYRFIVKTGDIGKATCLRVKI